MVDKSLNREPNWGRLRAKRFRGSALRLIRQVVVVLADGVDRVSVDIPGPAVERRATLNVRQLLDFAAIEVAASRHLGASGEPLMTSGAALRLYPGHFRGAIPVRGPCSRRAPLNFHRVVDERARGPGKNPLLVVVLSRLPPVARPEEREGNRRCVALELPLGYPGLDPLAIDIQARSGQVAL